MESKTTHRDGSPFAPAGGSASPWNGLLFLIMAPAMFFGGALIGAIWGAYKGFDAACFNLHNRKPGEWEFKRPSDKLSHGGGNEQ